MSILDKDSSMEEHWPVKPRFKDTCGPAFPSAHPHGQEEGITTLDYFAAKAMQGLMAQDRVLSWPQEVVAEAAYSQAEAMMKARQS